MTKITKIPANNPLSSDIKKLRVAAYCRVSTSSIEQLVSLEAQKQHYEKYIKSNPKWEYVGIYCDEGISGTKKEKRNQLLRLIKDCHANLIDFILTKSISRFARNTTDCLELVRQLLDLGVGIYFEKENIDTRHMDSELMLSILSSLAESESVSISQNNRWSIKRRYQKGTYIVSTPPYGYDNIDGEMALNEQQAEVVKLIFNKVLNGESANTIALYLQRQNIPTKRGGKWSSTAICGIIKNEKYTGDILYQKTYTDSQFNRHTNAGDVDQYYMENHHEPIISREIHEKANALLHQRAKEKGVDKGNKKYANRYSFTQKIICGECGTNFKRRTHANNKIAWCCAMHIENKDVCTMKYIEEEQFQVLFTTMLNKLIFAHKQILKPLLESVNRGNDKIDGINDLEKQMRENIKRRQTITFLMANGYLEQPVYELELSKLFDEYSNLQNEKDYLNIAVNSALDNIEEITKLYKFTEKAKLLTSFEDNLFNEFVEKILVKSRTEIEFKLKCGLCFIERL